MRAESISLEVPHFKVRKVFAPLLARMASTAFDDTGGEGSGVTYVWSSDLTECDAQVIVQQCNCISRTHAGLSADITRKFKHGDFYSKRTSPSVPGTIEIRGDNKLGLRWICAFYAQYYVSGPTQRIAPGYGKDSKENRVKWFQQCLEKLVNAKNLASIAFPYNIGCGLAKGDWETYDEMIHAFARRVPGVMVYIISQDVAPEPDPSDEIEAVVIGPAELNIVASVLNNLQYRTHIRNLLNSSLLIESNAEYNPPTSGTQEGDRPVDQDNPPRSEIKEGDRPVGRDNLISPDDLALGSGYDSTERDSVVEVEPSTPSKLKLPSIKNMEWDPMPPANDLLVDTLYLPASDPGLEELEWPSDSPSDDSADYTWENSTLLEFTSAHHPLGGWESFFETALSTESGCISQLSAYLSDQQSQFYIYPPLCLVYEAMNRISIPDIKVIIIGQDPYHGKNQAMGISFAVPPGVKNPPSLVNIYSEMKSEGIPVSSSANFADLLDKGVLLINTALTVVEGTPASHSKEWLKIFTPSLMEFLNEECGPLVIIMWGAHAAKFGTYFDDNKHRKITSVHPSPLSASKGFFGSRPFGATNDLLLELELEEIDWTL